jgi:hypothetical protein
MRKTNLFLIALLAVIFSYGNIFAVGVTVTGNTNTTPNMQTSYLTLAAAVTDINTITSISGQVVFTCTASGTETAPAGGYTINCSGVSGISSSNNIVIDGNSSTITAFTPQTSGNLNDAIFKLVGADYITLKNFTMQENASNSTTTPASNNMTEFGVVLFYKTTTDGAQNNTIQNNTISLNRTYLNTFGVYSNTRHSSTAVTTSAEVTSSAGANSFNKVYGNAISNVNYGIVFIGAGSTIAAIDNGNDIGGASALTGNTITNWGGGAAPTGYISLTGSSYCIFDNQQINDNVSYNTITSASLAQSNTVGGILKNYSVASPTSGTITTTINNNTVTITQNPSAATTGSIIGINNQGLTPLLSTATMSMNNNTVQNCVLGGSTSTTNALQCITNLSLPGTMNITGNSIINNAITSTAATSGLINGISNSGACGTLNITNNIIRSHASTATSGQPQGITNSGAVVTAVNITGNALGNATSGFFSTSTVTSGGLFGISNSGGASTCALTISRNDIRGITYNSAVSAAQTYITNTAVCLSQSIYSNTFTNLNVNTTGNVTFISNSVTAPAGGFKIIDTNSIVTAFNKGGAGGTVALYTDGGSSVCTRGVRNNNNNFSNITITGATTITGWFNNDGTGSTPTKTVSNNTFNNWTCGSSAVNVLQVNFGGSDTVRNNTISSITGSGAITGISRSTSGTVTTSLYQSNSITSLSSTGTGGAVTGLSYGSPASSTSDVSSNTINTLSSTSTTATVVGITSSGTNASINQNTINTLSCVGTTSGVTNGISITGGTTVNVFRNKIYDLNTSGAFTTAPGVNGIIASAGTTVNIYNNLVGDLRAAASTSTDAIRGISITSSTASTTYNVYYNSVYLTGAGGATFGTTGVFHTGSATATTAALTLRNNNIVNTCTAAGTGSVVAYRRSSTSLNNYTASSNQNNFYGTTYIYTDGTTPQSTLSGFKSAMSTRDQASYNENITYQSTTGSSSNFLKYSVSVATQLESGGVGIGSAPYPAPYNVDYTGTIRQGSTGYAGTGTAPDVGAWELEGIAADLTGPSITYTALGNGVATVNQTLTATITDIGSGVPTAGAGLPTLYYNINGGAYSGVTATSIGSNQYTFTFGSATTTAGDVVNYYVVAQDNAGTPNTSCFPVAGASGFSVNPPAVSTPPTTPSTYTCVATLSGTKTVGSGGDYTTLKAAFDDINAKVLSGNLTLSVLAGGTTETATASLNQVSYTGGTWTVTITPAAGQTPTITGALNSTALIKLNGADNVVIDGSNTQTTTKDLTLTNTSTGTGTTVVWLASQGTGAGCTGNTIKNCNISTGGNATATSYGIYAGSTTIGTAGDNNNSLTIQNNLITKCYQGINVSATASGLNTGLSITGNTIGSSTAGSEVTFKGINVVQATGANVNNNTIFNILMTAAGDPCGIEIGTGVVSSTFNANSISDVNGSNSSGYGGRGITVNTGNASSSITISNNLIWNIKGSGWSAFTSDAIAGILIGNTSSSTGGLNIYFNTVNLGSGTFSGNTSGTLSAALAVAQSGPTNLDIRNNIFATNLVNSAASGALTYAIYVGGTNAAFTSINYNCYYGTGTQGRVGVLNGGTSQTTLAGWQGVSGGDANSTISDPVFTSSTDIHISQAGSAYHTGLNGLSVTTDYTGATRNNPPSMGAYDAGINTGPTISYTPLGNGVTSTNQVLTAAIADAIDGVPTAGSGLPTLYYKSTTSVPAYTAVQGVYVSGNNYSFTFGSSVTGTGETVSYYIVAQDNGGVITQVTCSPSTGASGFSVNPPAVSTPPTTPSTYTTVGSISGIKTVGSGGDYATLTAAISALNSSVLTGALTFSLTDASYSEAGSMTINANSGSSPSNTVTIKPASGVSATITQSASSTATIIINGADYITIDGSNNGSTSKNLTITNTNTGTSSAVVWLQTATADGATNNTVKNCIITGNSNTTTLIGVGIGSSTISITSRGTSNNNCTIQNNTISKTQYGIYTSGASAGSKTSGTTISNNLMNTASPNNIQNGGIFANFESGATISGNTIGEISGGSTSFGITLGLTPSNSYTTVTGQECVGTTVSGNVISNIVRNGDGTAIGIGIADVSTASSAANTIVNNAISSVKTTSATPSDFPVGIYAGGGTGSTTNIFFNSVSMSAVSGVSTSTSPSYALAIGGSNPTITVKNNIFFNNQTSTTPGTTSKKYAIALAYSSSYSGLTSDYNVMYSTGAEAVFGIVGSLNPSTGTAQSNIATWRTTTGKDANSISSDPQFTSALNLVPVSSATSVIPELNSALTGTGYTTDVTGATRSTTNPDMGAYEFTSSLNLTGAGNTTLPGGSYSGLTWTGNTLTCSGNMTIDGTLTLSNGVINMGANTLTIGTASNNTGNLVRTGGSIIGTIKRWFGTNTTSNSVFPLDYGDGTNYVGAYISFTGAPSTGGTLTATFHSSGAGNLSDNGGLGYIDVGSLWPGVNFINLAQQYWTITAGDGLAGYTYDITLNANNMNVSSTSYLYTGVVKRSNGSQPWGWNQSNHVNTTSPSNVPTLGGTGFTSFSDFGVSGNMDNLLPVELAAFTANIDKRHVTLNWSTISESNNTGYDIERKTAESNVWSKLSFVEGHGTTALPQSYKYEDRNLATGKYNYRLKQIDNNGNYHYIPLTTLVEIGVPTKYDMSQNYPNPFNPSTKINFDLPFDSKVTIRLFDITGREVATILNQTIVAGYQTVQFNAASLSSGTYFYNIMAEGNNGNKFVNTKKMVLVK